MVRQISGTLTITIKKQDENYTIEAKGSKGIKVDPQPVPQLKTLLSDQQIIDTLKDLSSQTAPATTDAIQKLGKALYDSLFADRNLLLAFGKAQGSASSDSGARLRLQIEPIELAALPWETLHDGKDWLSAQITTPLVRKLTLSNNKKPLQKLQVRGALRILFVGASPEDLDRLKVEETADELETLLAGPIKKKQIVFDKLLNATLEDLQQGLLKDYHILYFAGHGSPEGIFLDDGQGDVIEKEGKVIGRERGDKSLVSAETLAQALKGKQTRLVFLAACETSKASEGSRLLRGFAQELAERSNLPAIVAMQYFISDMQANPLTTQFFAALAAGRSVDIAMAEARSVLMKKGQVSRDVFSPVLYLQAEDGALFPKAKNWPAISLGVALLMAAIVGGTFARNAEVNRANSLGRNSHSLFNEHKELEAFVEAIKAGQILKKQKATDIEVLSALQKAVYEGSEQNRIEGHEDSVESVTFSPDGKTLASGSRDNKIKIWNATTGKESFTLNGHTNQVNSISYIDSKTLASCSLDGTIKLWNLETGKVIHTYETKNNLVDNNQVNSISCNLDSKTLAFGSLDGTIKLWNLGTGDIRIFKGDDHSIEIVSFSPNGKTLASAAASNSDAQNDNIIKLWDVKIGKEIRTLKGHTGEVISLSFSPDGKILASGSIDQTIRFWNLETGKEIRTFKGHTGAVMSISFSRDGKTLASGSVDTTIKLWNVETGEEIRTLYGHKEPVNSVSLSRDGKTLASGSEDKTIKLWNLETENRIWTLNGDGSVVHSISFTQDSRTLASGSRDGTIKLWNLETGEGFIIQKGEVYGQESSRNVMSVSFSPDGRILASGVYDDDGIKLWNVETRKKIDLLKEQTSQIFSVSFSPDGKTLVSGGSNGLKLWNLQTGQEIPPLKWYGRRVRSISISPDGQTLVIGSDEGIKLWSLKTGQEIPPPLQKNDGEVSNVNFSSDSKTLAFSNPDETIKLWNLKTQDIRILRGHDSEVQSISFSGKILASGSFDGIKLWNTETGKEIQTLNEQSGWVSSISFSPDGKILASGNSNGNIKLWSFNLDYLIGRSCDWIRNYLTYNHNVSESDRHLCDGIGSQK
jgi:WD40 repeat protein/CHAT domain-containing protein